MTPPPEIVIEAGRAESQYWRDLWRFRELLYFLAWRDVLVRYKQTVIGILWAVIRPLLTMLVFTVVFGKFARLPSGGVPYPIFVLAGMLPWQFFANSLSEAGNSLLGNANLISKVYFPRLIIPASSVVTSLIDFAITLGLLALLLCWYGFFPDWRILTLPLWIAALFAAGMGGGLWLCALSVKYRDFRYITPFIVQFGLYLSPVGFASSLVPERWRLLYSLNPMTGIIDGFRWAILKGEPTIDPARLSMTVFVLALLLGTGIWNFRRTEKAFADII
jgi:lipopolysaccharide transport system permease protein